MLARQRQERILEALRASGGVRVSDLTEQLNVSYMTVRRDLDALAERGLVDKVHGGATIANQRSAEEPGFEAKSVRERPEKEAIAALAARARQAGHGDRGHRRARPPGRSPATCETSRISQWSPTRSRWPRSCATTGAPICPSC